MPTFENHSVKLPGVMHQFTLLLGVKSLKIFTHEQQYRWIGLAHLTALHMNVSERIVIGGLLS